MENAKKNVALLAGVIPQALRVGIALSGVSMANFWRALTLLVVIGAAITWPAMRRRSAVPA